MNQEDSISNTYVYEKIIGKIETDNRNRDIFLPWENASLRFEVGLKTFHDLVE